MVCSMVKKGLLGAALTAGGLFLVFGTSAPSYVRTAFHKARHHAKDAVPVQFEIDRARDEIAALEPAIKDHIEVLARAEVEVEHLDREIVATRENLAAEKRSILAESERLKNGDFRLAGHVTPLTEEEIKADLAYRFDHYRNVNRILEEKERTLRAKQQSVVAARKQLETMAAQKRALLTKLEGIEARLRMLEATRATNEFDFDDSALSRAKSTVSDLERRLEVMQRTSEMEGRFTETGVAQPVDEGRDVVKEIETELGGQTPSTQPTPGDRHL